MSKKNWLGAGLLMVALTFACTEEKAQPDHRGSTWYNPSRDRIADFEACTDKGAQLYDTAPYGPAVFECMPVYEDGAHTKFKLVWVRLYPTGL